MPGIALVRHVSAPLPARRDVRAERPSVEPEHVEEVWDAELVGELPPPGWRALPAVESYAHAGFARPAPRIDVYA
jgi:hypothetical protein